MIGRILWKFGRILGKHRLVAITEAANRRLRWLVQATHSFQQTVQWGLPPEPEWHDHHLDQYFGWSRLRNPYLFDRTAFNLLALKPETRILDLCCGDGYASYHWYWVRAASILAVDFDPEVIHHARRHFQDPRIRYEVADIRTDFPRGAFDNIVWDAAIEHFTPDEINGIMESIRDNLAPDGVLSGYTVASLGVDKQLTHHEYEFSSMDDLARFLTPHFQRVRVFENRFPERHNLYFFASTGSPLPFDDDWQHHVHLRF